MEVSKKVGRFIGIEVGTEVGRIIGMEVYVAQKTVFKSVDMSKTSNVPLLSPLAMSYVQNSRSGYKYASSFWTLTEALDVGASG